jgi:broad specificity phosphatase PhoE
MINICIGETLEAAAARAANVVDLLTTRFPNENLLIVTHAIHSIGLVSTINTLP